MSDNPNTCQIVCAVAGAAAGVALAPVIAPTVLLPLGFGTLGPIGGGMAAGIQAGMGNIAAGSLFATCQSIAMGGAIPTVVSAVSAGLGASLGWSAASGGPDTEGSNEEDSNDDGATGGDAAGQTCQDKSGGGAAGEDTAGQDGTSVDDGKGPAGEGAARTGPNRCPECQRRRLRFCRHP